MPLDEFRETNLRQWEERAALHWEGDGYAVREFVADPNQISRVIRFDAPFLKGSGDDLTGKQLVHLQCHIGKDTISLARLGAEVTGIDFSPSAITFARELAELCGTPANFVNCELYETPNHLPADSFDIVYTSVGAISWLPDIRGWAKVVAHLLKPGGILYLRDQHPMLWSLEDERDDGQLFVKYPYFEMEKPNEFLSDETYASDEKLTNKREYGWNHGLGETVTGVVDAGMQLEFLHEHRFIDWQAHPNMVQNPDGTYELPAHQERVPLQFSLKARKV